METESRHQCLIYDGPPSEKLPMLAAIIKRKLDEGYRCLYLNSAPMVAGLGSTLAALGVDVVAETTKEHLILSSEPVTAGEQFNCKALLDKLENTLDKALKDGYKGLWASGDMTWEFGPSKDFSKLLKYEMKLEELFSRRKELCGICQYHKDTMPVDGMRQSLLIHPHLVVSDTLTRVNPFYLKSSWPTNLKISNQMDETIAALCRA